MFSKIFCVEEREESNKIWAVTKIYWWLVRSSCWQCYGKYLHWIHGQQWRWERGWSWSRYKVRNELGIHSLTQHIHTCLRNTFKLITGVFVYAMLKRYISTTTSHTIKTCGCNCGHNFYGYQGKRKTSKDELVIFVAKEVVTMNSSWPVCTFVF